MRSLARCIRAISAGSQPARSQTTALPLEAVVQLPRRLEYFALLVAHPWRVADGILEAEQAELCCRRDDAQA